MTAAFRLDAARSMHSGYSCPRAFVAGSIKRSALWAKTNRFDAGHASPTKCFAAQSASAGGRIALGPPALEA
jgi:hypothetical protein